MNVRVACLALVIPPLLLFAVGAVADSDTQAMTVFGGDATAQRCYHAATMAARNNMADEKSVAVCTRALRHSELDKRDRMATFVNRGILHASRREIDAAAADYESAIAMGPASGEVYVDRGNLAFLRKDYAGAIADYTYALQLGLAKDFVAYTNRALAHEHLNDFRAARADYELAVERAPDWTLPRAKLAALTEFERDSTREEGP